MLVTKNIDETFVLKQVISYQTQSLAIVGAELPTDDDPMPFEIRKYKESYWINASGKRRTSYECMACGTEDGFIDTSGYPTNYKLAIRPVLVFKDISDNNWWNIGDVFKFCDKEFQIFTKTRAFCLSDIGASAYRKNVRVKDVLDYEKSDAKKVIDKWFQESLEKGYQF